MEEQRKNEIPCLQEAPDWAKETLAPVKPPFAASRKERILAFLLYLLAYVYLGSQWWVLPLFAAGFIAAAEYRFRDVKRPRESWIWLLCVVMIVGCLTWRELHPDRFDSRLTEQLVREYAIPSGLAFLALHILAVYWLLCRAGRLTGSESGHLLPLDALLAFIVIPFKNLFLRIRCVIYALKPKKERAVNAGAIAGAVLAAFAALVLLVLAMTQLSAADDTFSELLGDIQRALTPDLDQPWFYRLLLSLPVGAYLFGLLAGLGRETPEAMRARGDRALGALPKLRTVPETIWIAALGMFSAVYLVFFFVQGRYLFGAFTRTLPESFTVAQYARQGFFELCRVMAINLTLFWLVTRTRRQESKPVRWMAAALLIESMLFAVVAVSKLALYIDCFGLTPLRVQSTWLVCVLLVGCGCALYTHLTGKKSMRVWMIFGALTLALLCAVQLPMSLPLPEYPG